MGIMKRRLIWLSLSLVMLLYLLQLPTPLRVNTDGTIYLSLAASFNDGHGFIWHSHKAHFPSGYPAVIAGLERIGMGNSAGLITWNYLMIAIAGLSGGWLLQRWLNLSKSITSFLILMYLLGWATIRYALIPGSEMTYLAISFLCLQCLTIAETADGIARWGWWILALILMPMAMSIRLVGVVLPPAGAWAFITMLWRRRPAPQISFRAWIQKYKTRLTGLGIIALMLFSGVFWAVTRTSYFREDASLMMKHGILKEMVFTLKQRLLESASMLSNIPTKNVFLTLQHPLIIGGIPCLALILLLLWRRTRSLTSVDVYLIAYVVLLMVWPYDADVRFWLPAQLFIFALLAREISDLRSQAINIACYMWITIFAILGLASFAWNTRMTYSGEKFSERWTMRAYRDTYRLASRNGLPVDPDAVNPDLLPVLRRFGGGDFNK
jgi:hypothetical protein